MDPQPQSAPPYGSFPPPSDPSYNSRPGPPPRASTLPHHPVPETTYPQPLPSQPSAPYTSYPPPQIQLPMQTASTTSTSYTQPPLAHASPRPISDPKFEPLHAAPLPNPVPQQAPPPQLAFPPPPTSAAIATTQTPGSTTSISRARDNAASALRELLAVRRQQAMVYQQQQHHDGGGVNGVGKVTFASGGQAAAEVDSRARLQTGEVLHRLRGLQGLVGQVAREGERGRWRRVFIGGVIASFIPLVKKLFGRPKHGDEAANRTEYAFKRSRSLVSRILASVHRPGLGTLAFFVFAVLYVFTNEVTLRVAKTLSKRLRRLVGKVEEGRAELTEDDVKSLQGWRWRILIWSD